MENKIATAALAGILAEKSGKNKKFCEDFIREFFRLAGDALASGENVKIKGFGTFKIIDIDSREGVNVNTGERHEIAAHKKVVFTPSKEMAAIVNVAFADFETTEIEDSVSPEILEASEIPDEALLTVEKEVKEERPGTRLIEEGEVFVKEETKDEVIIDEDAVPSPILEAGSDEENEDDNITNEAYSLIDNDEKVVTPIEVINDTLKEEGQKVPDIPLMPDVPHKEETEPIEKNEINEDDTVRETVETYEDQNEENMEDNRKNNFGLGFLFGVLTSLVICLIVFMLGCFLQWWPVNFGYIKGLSPVAETEQIQNIPSEEPAIVAENEEKEEPASVVSNEPKTYDTVTTTRYLTTIARDHYGNFNLWPYIYLENQDILGHPDRITPGTRVVVPPLSKYGVNPARKADIDEAKRKGAEIYARYR